MFRHPPSEDPMYAAPFTVQAQPPVHARGFFCWQARPGDGSLPSTLRPAPTSSSSLSCSRVNALLKKDMVAGYGPLFLA